MIFDAHRDPAILDASDARFARSHARLSPYAQTALERSARHALRLHSDVVTPEHLLSTLMDDPRSAACALVLHAFADPPTIADEALAISPGVMVVASGGTLPFSPLGLQALVAARLLARDQREAEVEDVHLVLQSAAVMDEELVAALSASGFDLDRLRAQRATESASPVPTSGPLFKHFSSRAKHALTHANHIAAGFKLDAISPAHVLLGALKDGERMTALCGLTFQRARLVLAGNTADETEPRPRSLSPDGTLIAFVEGLPDRADTLALLARFLAGDTPELAQILSRNKITAELIERARGAFEDP
jgi:ATP-dependent Clp protease ATP-binding subunit ClpA